MQTRGQETIGKGGRDQEGRGGNCTHVIVTGRATRDGNGEHLLINPKMQ